MSEFTDRWADQIRSSLQRIERLRYDVARLQAKDDEQLSAPWYTSARQGRLEKRAKDKRKEAEARAKELVARVKSDVRGLVDSLESAFYRPTYANLAKAMEVAGRLDDVGSFAALIERLDPEAARAIRRTKGTIWNLFEREPEPGEWSPVTDHGRREYKRRKRKREQERGRRLRKEQTKQRRRDRHNRRSKERDQIKILREKWNSDEGLREKWKDADWDKKRQMIEDGEVPEGGVPHIGRSLGLANAKGIGVAMVAHVMSLSPEERARFFATPNHVGFTDAAVREYEQMIKQRETDYLRYMERGREQEARQAAARVAVLAPKRCFVPSRDVQLRWAAARADAPRRGIGVLAIPLTREELLDALRAVYRAGVSRQRCATGVTTEQFLAASELNSFVANSAMARGWVKLRLGRTRFAIFHLPTRLLALQGGIVPQAARPRDVVPFDVGDATTVGDLRRGRSPGRKVARRTSTMPTRRRVVGQPPRDPWGGRR